MKDQIAILVSKALGMDKSEVISLIEVPPSEELGDFALPCFSFAKSQKKNPVEIAKTIVEKVRGSKDFEKVGAKGPYVNFFVNKSDFSIKVVNDILKLKNKYGSSNEFKGKVMAIDLSAPNIAKPFGIGHLRSTIIGNSISNIAFFSGYKTIKINYLGDWGTQFGKLVLAYKKWGVESKLKENPIVHLQELYVKISSMGELEDQARAEFKKLEDGDKENLGLWKKFRKLSLIEFNKIYDLLDVKFDVISGESEYNNLMEDVVKELGDKKLIKESEGAQIVDIEKFGLGVCLIKKKDGATLYATRDIAAAIDRYKRFNFDKMIYEVGGEQSLHFKQFFKVLELMGYSFAENAVHVAHGLYLDSDGKKFSTRKGKTVYMADILAETIQLAKEEVKKREKLNQKELDERSRRIALAAIYYGDLKNYRENNIVFDIDRFVSFEGNTGPYLLYTYARAKSILAKSNAKVSKITKVKSISEKEKSLIMSLSKFSEVIRQSLINLSPNLIANYAFDISQKFNEFYHSEQVIGSENEKAKLALVLASSIVLQNALSLLGIKTLEKM